MEKLYNLYRQHPKICTDSRNCEPGALFFALKGEKFDANKFALSALEAGCAYAVIDNPKYKTNDQFIVVNDVLKTLQQLAAYHRKQLGTSIIGITGTNGKTTTKELTAGVLSTQYVTHFTQGNLNNHIGVPLTLLQLTAEHQVAVVEMGANHPDEIAFLATLVAPDFGIVTNVGRAHLEGFGSFKGVMKTKRELYENVHRANGKIFINTGNSFLVNMAKRAGFIDANGVLTYELNSELKSHIAVGKAIANTPKLAMKCKTAKGEFEVKTNLIGAYNAENVLAAVAIGYYFGIDNELIKRGIENYKPANNRSQLVKTSLNHLIVDAYNANPTSMQAAIHHFLQMDVTPKMYILGDMLELGNTSLQEHQQIVNFLEKKKQKNVLLVGMWFAKTKNPFHTFLNTDELLNYLAENKITNKYVLIKASHGVHLERVINLL